MARKIDGGLRALFKTKLPHFFWIPIETPISGGGVPDHHFCYNGVSGWNEYKFITGNKIKFRPEQVGWHDKYARFGGRSFIIVWWQKKELMIYRGRDAIELSKTGVRGTEPVMHIVNDKPATWPWQMIEEVLLR